MELLKNEYEISLWNDVPVIEYWPTEAITLDGVPCPVNSYSLTKEQAESWSADTNRPINEYFNIVEYHDEQKLLIIGSDTMDVPYRAHEACLIKNVNGYNELNFTVYYRYYDEEQQKFVENPYRSLFINERKVKLHYKNEWFDFIIKEIDEDRDSHSIKIKAVDALINELSKTGFNIEFDTELGNNIGTIQELAQTIVDGTEWEIKEGDLFLERKDSPLYEIIFNAPMALRPLNTDESYQFVTEDMKAYGFYQSVRDVIDGKTTSLQVLFDPSQRYDIDDSNHILEIIDDSETYLTSQYFVDELTADSFSKYTIDTSSEENTDISAAAPLSRKLIYDKRGYQLIQSSNSVYDPVMGKVVSRFTRGEDENGNEELIYMYTTTSTTVQSITKNLLDNAENFVNENCWLAMEGMTIERKIFPSTTDLTLGKYHNCLRFTGSKGTESRQILNNSISSNFTSENGIVPGQKYVFRVSVTNDDANKTDAYTKLQNVSIRDYKIVDGKVTFSDKNSSLSGQVYVSFDMSNWQSDRKEKDQFALYSGTTFESGVDYYEIDYDSEDLSYKKTTDTKPNLNKKYFYKKYYNPSYYVIGIAGAPLSLSNLYSGVRKINGSSSTGWRVGLFMQFESGNYLLEQAQLFPYQELENGSISFPGDCPAVNNDIVYHYYEKPDDVLMEKEDVTILYEGAEKQPYVPYEEKNGIARYQKHRTIIKKESNRFDLLQTLCETFGCWIRFFVKRDETTGKILREPVYDEAGINCSSRMEKYIQFLEYIGDDNRPGFVYGINLKGISRQVNSDQIVTKLIVKQNSNEHATNGFCTIARAEENENGDNFLLNVDYYLQQGILDQELWTQELYNDNTNIGPEGYYIVLKRLKEEYQKEYRQYSLILNQIDAINSELSVYTSLVNSALEENQNIENLSRTLISDTKNSAWDVILKELKNRAKNNDTTAASYIEKHQVNELNISCFNPVVDNLERQLSEAETEAITHKNQTDFILEEINTLNANFYRKYSHIIQEGSWTSEDYVDDNLYYVDALSVLYGSAFPQVSYSINVMDISGVEGFGKYTYDIGDKTYIEDVDFFGYRKTVGTNTSEGFTNKIISTPYRQEIIISEVKEFLDDPSQNTITVQNYKTQFEDLFQRITATTQSLQYATASYKKAAKVVTDEGAIAPNALVQSLQNVDLVIQNPSNQTVRWDNEGITTTDRDNNTLKINAGGIQIISGNGQDQAHTAITPQGVNTNTLTAGVINAGNIVISNKDHPTFQWNAYGLNAYDPNGVFNPDEEEQVSQIENTESNTSNDDNIEQETIEEQTDQPLLTRSLFTASLLAAEDANEESNENTEQVIENDDKVYNRTFVRFDWNGLYGIENLPEDKNPYTWTPNNFEELEECAKFGLIWDRFFLKSDNHGGEVKISSDNDIQVIGENDQGSKIERIKIGRIDKGNDGKEIYGIKINNINDEPVMVTNDDGNLTITGTIYATDGEFSGILNAVKGTFGDVQVGDIRLYEDNGNGFISIDKNGTRQFELKDDGTLRLSGNGNAYVSSHIYIGKDDEAGVVIDGTNSSIRSKDFSVGTTGWQISEDQAEFNNVVVRGAIKSAVMEYDRVQTVGGQLLVRPSTIIKKVEGNVITVETLEKGDLDLEQGASGFIAGDYCVISDKKVVYIITAIDYTNKTLTLERASTDTDSTETTGKIAEVGEILINVGRSIKNDGVYEGSGILINGTESTAFGPAKSLSMFTSNFVQDENTNDINWERQTKLQLGDLSNVTHSFLNINNENYGLYADNVILNGTLASYGINGFAGINSKSNVKWKDKDFENFFPNEQAVEGPIILWAGKYTEAGDVSAQIQDAAFKVDKNGNMYARSAYFEGTILSNSYIQASTIKTAVIEGTGKDDSKNEYGLTLKDLKNGMQFITTTEEDGDKQLFVLDAEKVSSSLPFEINNVIKATRFVSNTAKNGYVSAIQNNRLGFIASDRLDDINESAASFIQYNGQNIEIGSNTASEKIYQTIGDNKIQLSNTNSIILSPNNYLKLDNKKNAGLQYKKVDNGYDLYII